MLVEIPLVSLVLHDSLYLVSNATDWLIYLPLWVLFKSYASDRVAEHRWVSSQFEYQESI